MLASKLLYSIPQSIRIIRKISTESIVGTLTLQQLRVLTLVKEGHGQTQMADILQVSLAAISKMVNGLVKKKLLTRKAGADRRTQLLTLTPKGKSTLGKVTKYVERKLQVSIDELTKEEKEQLMQGLEILDQLMKKVKEV